MCPGNLSGIIYLNHLLGGEEEGGEEDGETLGIMVLAHLPKAPGSWVPWGPGPVELRRVSTCLSEEQFLLPRFTSVFHRQPVNSQ